MDGGELSLSDTERTLGYGDWFPCNCSSLRDTGTDANEKAAKMADSVTNRLNEQFGRISIVRQALVYV